VLVGTDGQRLAPLPALRLREPVNASQQRNAEAAGPRSSGTPGRPGHGTSIAKTWVRRLHDRDGEHFAGSEEKSIMSSLTRARIPGLLGTFTLLAGLAAPGARAGETPGGGARLVGPAMALARPEPLQQRPAAAEQLAGPERLDGRLGQPSTGKLVSGGVLGAGAGIVAGIGVGRIAANDCDDYLCGLAAGVLGVGVAAAADTALVPLGVHMANGRQGSYGWSLAASTAIAAGGIVLAGALSDQHESLAGATVVSIPVLQVISSIVIERKTAERRQARRNR
jgi:hypothetical protein